MTRRVVIVAGVPLVVAALVAVPLGLWRGPYQWLCAGIALALTVTPGVATLVIADRLGKSPSPYGRVLALFVGTFLRLAVGFGGAVIVFYAARDTFRTDPVSYWAWILGAYLLMLIVETTVLGRGLMAKAAGERETSIL